MRIVVTGELESGIKYVCVTEKEHKQLQAKIEQQQEALGWLLEEYHFLSRKMTEINNIVQPLWGELRERRYGSFFGNPNALGYFIALLFPAYIMLTISNRNKKYIFFIAMLTLIFMLSQTESRGPMISCALSTLLLFLFHIRKFKKYFEKQTGTFS